MCLGGMGRESARVPWEQWAGKVASVSLLILKRKKKKKKNPNTAPCCSLDRPPGSCLPLPPPPRQRGAQTPWWWLFLFPRCARAHALAVITQLPPSLPLLGELRGFQAPEVNGKQMEPFFSLALLKGAEHCRASCFWQS